MPEFSDDLMIKGRQVQNLDVNFKHCLSMFGLGWGTVCVLEYPILKKFMIPYKYIYLWLEIPTTTQLVLNYVAGDNECKFFASYIPCQCHSLMRRQYINVCLHCKNKLWIVGIHPSPLHENFYMQWKQHLRYVDNIKTANTQNIPQKQCKLEKR